MIELIQGHALDVLERMAGESMYDAVITDPPYASGASTQSGVAASTSVKYTNKKRGDCPFPDFEGDAMDKRGWASLMTRVLTLAREHTHQGRCNRAVCGLEAGAHRHGCFAVVRMDLAWNRAVGQGEQQAAKGALPSAG